MSKQLTVPQQLWVDALRSGEYQQTKHELQSLAGYCCLGVACVVAEQNGVSVNYHGKELFGTSLRQQPAVQDWLGLTSTCGDFSTNGNNEEILMYLNDGEGKTFAEIADVIEANADKLFKD